ncbi:MAG TPA: BT_3928 family protein [Bacteroidales bacterium]|nr:BT_3928 family protein [Bacteroidales bacterium]
MKIIRQISTIIVGLIFIFSGVVKGIDPLGSAYKFHDYFLAFNMAWLDWLCLPLGILLCTAEFIAGFSVISGVRQKTGIWVVLLLMIIFTPLTFVLALNNPVSDCGCFGDAIHLTNWQTFWKNVILITLAIVLFTGRRQAISLFKTSSEWIITGIVTALFALFCFGNLKYLPIIDFLPYKTEIKIADQMVIPEGAEPDKYQTTFIYEKNGEQKEFTLENYPADDTSWIFVDQKTVLLKKGYQPPVHDFTITNSSGVDLTNQILSDKGYSLFMISGKLTEADTAKLLKGFELGHYVGQHAISFYILTATSSDELVEYMNGLIFCTVDETTLKSMVRANPGYMLLKDGVIKGKWSWATVPENEWFHEIISDNKVMTKNTGTGTFTVITIIGFLLLFLAILGLNIKKYKN